MATMSELRSFRPAFLNENFVSESVASSDSVFDTQEIGCYLASEILTIDSVNL